MCTASTNGSLKCVYHGLYKINARAEHEINLVNTGINIGKKLASCHFIEAKDDGNRMRDRRLCGGRGGKQGGGQ